MATNGRHFCSLNLSEHRSRKGVSLKRIADTTKINVCYLEAIEAEEFERLPGGIFSISYIRQYAAAVGSDEQPILARFSHCCENGAADSNGGEEDGRHQIPIRRSVSDWIRHRSPIKLH